MNIYSPAISYFVDRDGKFDHRLAAADKNWELSEFE